MRTTSLLGKEPVVLDPGADPAIRDAIHGGMADGWAQFGGHDDIAALLRQRP
jgi:hypothetical protein